MWWIESPWGCCLMSAFSPPTILRPAGFISSWAKVGCTLATMPSAHSTAKIHIQVERMTAPCRREPASSNVTHIARVGQVRFRLDKSGWSSSALGPSPTPASAPAWSGAGVSGLCHLTRMRWSAERSLLRMPLASIREAANHRRILINPAAGDGWSPRRLRGRGWRRSRVAPDRGAASMSRD